MVEVIQSVFSDHSEILLEISNRNLAGKSPNIWKFKTLKNNPWAKEKVSMEPHKKENATYENLWDTAKAVLGGKFIALQCLY